ncbi:hypothetical protein D3C71_1936080 [compost metagenome]
MRTGPIVGWYVRHTLRCGGHFVGLAFFAFADEGHRRRAVGVELEDAPRPALFVEEHLA